VFDVLPVPRVDLLAGAVKWAMAGEHRDLQSRWRRLRNVDRGVPADPVQAVLELVEARPPVMGSLSLFELSRAGGLFSARTRRWEPVGEPLRGRMLTVSSPSGPDPQRDEVVVLFANGGLGMVSPAPGRPDGVLASSSADVGWDVSAGTGQQACSRATFDALGRVAVWGADHTQGRVRSRVDLAVVLWRVWSRQA
jgi:hypothetical protein